MFLKNYFFFGLYPRYVKPKELYLVSRLLMKLWFLVLVLNE